MRQNCIYRRLAICMSMLPATGADMAEKIGVRQETVGQWMRWLRAAGVVAPAARRLTGEIVWGHGTGRPFALSGVVQPSLGVSTFAAFWAAVQRRGTVADIARDLGVGRRTVNYIVQATHEAGIVRIAAWQVVGSAVVPMYDRLPEADAPRPERQTKAETNARYWEKHRGALSERGLSSRVRLPDDLRRRERAAA